MRLSDQSYITYEKQNSFNNNQTFMFMHDHKLPHFKYKEKGTKQQPLESGSECASLYQFSRAIWSIKISLDPKEWCLQA